MESSCQQASDDLMTLLSSVKRIAGNLAEERNLTKVQLFALYSLHQNGELAMGKVADVWHCDASNVTGIVDRLVTQDLVSRKECAHDRRAKTLQLTAKGKKIVESTQQELPALLGCDKLTAEERRVLHDIIFKLSVV